MVVVMSVKMGGGSVLGMVMMVMHQIDIVTIGSEQWNIGQRNGKSLLRISFSYFLHLNGSLSFLRWRWCIIEIHFRHLRHGAAGHHLRGWWRLQWRVGRGSGWWRSSETMALSNLEHLQAMTASRKGATSVFQATPTSAAAAATISIVVVVVLLLLVTSGLLHHSRPGIKGERIHRQLGGGGSGCHLEGREGRWFRCGLKWGRSAARLVVVLRGNKTTGSTDCYTGKWILRQPTMEKSSANRLLNGRSMVT